MTNKEKEATIYYLKGLIKDVPMPMLQFEHEKEVVLDALEALKQADKYRWHIIGECPDELPKFDTDLEVVNDEGIHHIAQLTSRGSWGTEWRIKYCLYDTDTWCEDENGTIIAWRYIEPFDVPDTNGEMGGAE